MNLSPHFTLAEMTVSQEAERRSIANIPPPNVIANLRRTAWLLEDVRALVGRPVSVSSAYRSPALNQAVGGALNSAHMLGLAADIVASGVLPRALALLIRESNIQFDQLIYEGAWVHIGLTHGAPRREVLTAKFINGRAVYTPGL